MDAPGMHMITFHLETLRKTAILNSPTGSKFHINYLYYLIFWY